MGWRNRQDSRVRDAEPRAKYPWMQWVNRGSDLDPRHTQGGFFITAENMDVLGEVKVDSAEACTLNFSNNASATGIYLQGINIAVLGTRFAWTVEEGGRICRVATWVPGARSKMQALVLLQAKEGHTEPLMLTLTGTVTEDLKEAIKVHREVIRQTTERKGATPWFWLHLIAGEPERRGSGSKTSMVTPILCPDTELDLEQAYVGDEIADWEEDFFETVEAWIHEWDNAGEEHEVEQPPLSDDEAPLSTPAATRSPSNGNGNLGPMAEARRLWSVQWNRLKKLGVSPPILNNAWSVDQINAATTLMRDAAQSIDEGNDREFTAATMLALLLDV